MPIFTANLSQQWSELWYPSTIQNLIQISGLGDNDEVTGAGMPNLSAIDTMALLGLVTPAVVSAIERFAKQQGVLPPILRSDRVNVDGTYRVQPEYDGPGIPRPETEMTDVAKYLGYQTDFQSVGLVSEAPWQRYPWAESTEASSFEPYVSANADSESLAYLGFIRQMISDWQRMVDSAASAISQNSADATQPAPTHDLSEFLRALRSLCADFDVLNENPPELGKITDALKFALAKSSEFVGKAAALVSEEVGKTAGIIGGNLTEGFLANAGILSIIVVAIVIHLYI
jgi:hypothetical protein